jgi:hypothetical protein
MFFSGFKLQLEKIQLKKKVQSSRLTSHFFRRVQIKKRYSPLADGGGSDLAGTLQQEKKCTVVWPAMFFSGFKLQPEKVTTEKKGTVVWPTFFSGHNLSWS